MLLVIDAGNTNVCWALFQGRQLIKEWRTATNCCKRLDEWSEWLLQEIALAGFSQNDIEDMLISCVVPDLLPTLQNLCIHCFSRKALVVGESSAPFPNASLIDQPGEEGADLMVNAFAAHILYQGPLLVVDFGTATTLSLVDGQGNFCGTVIAPGVQLSLHALYQAAAKLPEISVAKPLTVIGTNTRDSMRSGIFWGYVSMIEGLVQRIKEENFKNLIQKELKVIATGGLSSLIAPSCPAIAFVDPSLTLKGLALIYETLSKGNKNVVYA